MMTRSEVIDVLSEHKPELMNRYGVKSLALFGSLGRDQAQTNSDVDVLVEFGRPTGLFGLFSLQNYLETLLGRAVDLGTLKGLKPRMRERVLAEKVNVI
ncbi:MAG: putative nucleotidyltransferase [Candidatus Latescibacterota bacterium]|jgi:predicted nucleotidyltransferase